MKITIELPENIIKKIEKRAKTKNFENVEDYITSVLVQISEKIDANKKIEKISEKDEEEIKKRLKNLGYLE